MRVDLLSSNGREEKRALDRESEIWDCEAADDEPMLQSLGKRQRDFALGHSSE